MLKVQEATYTPGPDGGELRANLMIGRQELTTTWPLDSATEHLQMLLDQVMVKVQQVTYVSNPLGGEIRATMTVGDRTFVSRLAVEGEDQDLQTQVDRLLDEIGRTCIQTLQAALQQENAPAG